MEPTENTIPPGKTPVLHGSCACGQCIVSACTLPISVTLCHCIACRKVSGAPFLCFGRFHNDALEWSSSPLGSDAPIKETPSRRLIQGCPIAIRGSCGKCGSPLFMKYHCRPDGTSIAMGIVDNPGVIGKMPQPTAHIFLKEKAEWWSLPDNDGLARYDSFDEAYEKRFEEWISKGCIRRSDVRN